MTVGALIVCSWGCDVAQFKRQCLPLVRFWIGFVLLLGFGHPCTMVNLLVVFAGTLGEGRQGEMMGYLGLVGSLARMLGPVFATVTLNLFGVSFLFSLVGI